MEKNEIVSFNSGSHNRDYDEIPIFEATIDGNSIVISGKTQPDIVGCKFLDPDGFEIFKFCRNCRCWECPDDFVCLLDSPWRVDVKLIYSDVLWQS